MLAALTYNAGSAAQAQKLVDWIVSLGSWPPQFLLCHEASAPQINVPIGTQITNYVDRARHHPESKNLAFQAVAVHVELFLKQSFLYLESDCVPLVPEWFTRIEAEYSSCGQPYMGPIMEASRPHGSPRHMAAIAVYPWDLVRLGGGEGLIANEEPFPAAMARGMLKMVHPTSLIQHDWEGKGLSGDCVLYHPDRDGSVLEKLRGGESCASILHQSPIQSTVDALCVSDASDAAPTSEPESAAESAEWCFHCHALRGSPEANSNHACNFVPVSDKTWLEKAKELGATITLEPWENKLESQEAIKRLCKQLKAFCIAPKYTAWVRDELKSFGVVPGRSKVPRKKRRGLG